MGMERPNSEYEQGCGDDGFPRHFKVQNSRTKEAYDRIDSALAGMWIVKQI
jgi:hypothetical protein